MADRNKLSYTGRIRASESRLGDVQFDSADFSVTDGLVSLSATGNLENLAADSGSLTPASASITVAGGDSVDTSGSGSTLTVAVQDEAIKWIKVSLTAAEIKALAASQKTLIAAPGANKAIHFLGALLKLNAGSEVLTESADNLVIKYTDDSGVAVSGVIESTGFIDQSSDTYTNATPVADAIVAASACENQALVLDNNGDGEIAGNASNDATLDVHISYRIIDQS